MNLNSEISELIRALAKSENAESLTIYEYLDDLIAKDHVTEEEKEKLAVLLYKNSSCPDEPDFYQLSAEQQNYYRRESEATLVIRKRN